MKSLLFMITLFGLSTVSQANAAEPILDELLTVSKMEVIGNGDDSLVLKDETGDASVAEVRVTCGKSLLELVGHDGSVRAYQVKDFYRQGCSYFVQSLSRTAVSVGTPVAILFTGVDQFPGLMIGRSESLVVFVPAGNLRGGFKALK